VKELMKYVNVDSYGACLHNRDLPEKFQVTRYQCYGLTNCKGKIYDNHGKSMANKIEMFSKYKFAITFENNAHIEDYVTEKLMCTLQSGAVPSSF
jgi:hypothetical protein